MSDTLLCRDKKDAKNYVDVIGAEYIVDWDFKPNGEVLLTLADGWREQFNEQRKSN